MTEDELSGSVVDQQTPPPQVVPDAGQARASRPAPLRARLTVRFQPALNAALWQNHVPVLSDLAVANEGELSIDVRDCSRVATIPVGELSRIALRRFAKLCSSDRWCLDNCTHHLRLRISPSAWEMPEVGPEFPTVPGPPEQAKA